MNKQEHIYSLAAEIQLLVLDVDGILTDGKLHFSNSGEEIKAFNTLDGLGIKLLQQAQVGVALITGRQSEIVAQRARNLGIKHVFQGSEDKQNILAELIKKLGLQYSQVAYAGDDLPDLPCIKKVKLGITVPNGHFLVQDAADVITTREGGCGAVREICDMILQAQGKFENAVSPFL